MANKNSETCKNSQTVINGLEYFLVNGELFRARVSNPIDSLTGFRQGGRWEAPAHMAKDWLEMVKSAV